MDRAKELVACAHLDGTAAVSRYFDTDPVAAERPAQIGFDSRNIRRLHQCLLAEDSSRRGVSRLADGFVTPLPRWASAHVAGAGAASVSDWFPAETSRR